MADRKVPNSQQGFALIEVMIATLILGTSLVTLLSLQSSSVQRTLRDRNEQQAMLIARSMMSAIEIDPGQIEPQDITMEAAAMLEDLLPAKSEGTDPEFARMLERFQSQLVVEEKSLPLPTAEILVLKRVYLRIFWSESPADKLEVIFFVQPDTPEPV